MTVLLAKTTLAKKTATNIALLLKNLVVILITVFVHQLSLSSILVRKKIAQKSVNSVLKSMEKKKKKAHYFLNGICKKIFFFFLFVIILLP